MSPTFFVATGTACCGASVASCPAALPVWLPVVDGGLLWAHAGFVPPDCTVGVGFFAGLGLVPPTMLLITGAAVVMGGLLCANGCLAAGGIGTGDFLSG